MKSIRVLRPKAALAAACVVAVLAVNLYADVNSPSFTLVSHQPAVFLQMEALVTPAATDVARVLAEALAAPVAVARGQTEPLPFDKIRGWVYSHIEYVPDDKSHGVEDYWQTPAETIALGTGDCEDFAILLVSLLRAYGAPDDQVYVAVGDDLNGLWHAYVVERCCNGIWRIMNAEYDRDPSYLDSVDGQTYNVAYCFNDRRGFRGLPEYPPDYEVPDIPDATYTRPPSTRVQIKGTPNKGWFDGEIYLTDPTFDEAKKRMSKLFLPAYLPPGYGLSRLSVSGNWSMSLMYHNPDSTADFYIFESPSGIDMVYPPEVVEEVTVNGSKAYLLHGAYYQGTSMTVTIAGTGTYVLSSGSSGSIWSADLGVSLYFPLDGWVITIRAQQPASWTTQDLIKIAESLRAY